MADKTSFSGSLMHMIKGNLGTGILAMPASFAHCGLIGGSLGLPLLCIVATYCVHILVRSTVELEKKSRASGVNLVDNDFDYAILAKQSLQCGPSWLQKVSGFMAKLIDATLIVAQLGVCCVYLVFVVDNISSILSSYDIYVDKTYVFMFIYPITVLLSYIKTLNRLAVASTCANMLQAVGISLILEFLIRGIGDVNLAERDNLRPLNEFALGFGSAMFAFEGVSVVIPIYLKLKNPDRMSSCFGLINIAYLILLILYFAVGFFGYLKFGHEARDSITLNLPPTPLYDMVRLVFTCSVILTYPLQFYVPNEIIWSWAKQRLLSSKSPLINSTDDSEDEICNVAVSLDEAKQVERPSQREIYRPRETLVAPQVLGFGTKTKETKTEGTNSIDLAIKLKSSENMGLKSSNTPNYQSADNETHGNCSKRDGNIIYATTNTLPLPIGSTHSRQEKSCLDPHFSQQVDESEQDRELYFQNYCCRTILVSLTFALAMVVPKLNLLMDLIGSISGTALSLIFPAVIHIGAYWTSISGISKVALLVVDVSVIVFGLMAGFTGAVFSFSNIINSFQ